MRQQAATAFLCCNPPLNPALSGSAASIQPGARTTVLLHIPSPPCVKMQCHAVLERSSSLSLCQRVVSCCVTEQRHALRRHEAGRWRLRRPSKAEYRSASRGQKTSRARRRVSARLRRPELSSLMAARNAANGSVASRARALRRTDSQSPSGQCRHHAMLLLTKAYADKFVDSGAGALARPIDQGSRARLWPLMQSCMVPGRVCTTCCSHLVFWVKLLVGEMGGRAMSCVRGTS